MSSKKDLINSWSRILAQAWVDEEFKEQLRQSPNKMLKENGFTIGANEHYTILEDTDEKKNIVIHHDLKHFEYIHAPLTNSWHNLIREYKKSKTVKEELLRNPYQTMKKYGIPASADYSYHVVEDTETQKYLVITKPSEMPLSEIDLKRVSGGGCATGGFCTDTSC